MNDGGATVSGSATTGDGMLVENEEGRGLPESRKQKKKNGKKFRKRRQTCVDENDVVKRRKDNVQLCAAYLCHQPEKKNNLKKIDWISCDECQDCFHLVCMGLKKVPKGKFACGCTQNFCYRLGLYNHKHSGFQNMRYI